MNYFCCLFDSSGGQDQAVDYGGSTSADPKRLAKWDLLMDEGENYQRDQWQLVMSQKMKALAVVQSRRPSKLSNPELQSISTEDNPSPDSFLQALSTLYTEHGYAQRMPHIREIFTDIRPFVLAVTTLVQTNTIAALVWGSLNLVFESVLRFAKFWEDLRVMYEDVAKALPRFHGYVEVLHTPRLHASLRNVYSTFLDMCFMTLDCLQSNQCLVLLQISWSSFAYDFQRTAESLRSLNEEFEKEAQLAHVQEESRRHTEILATLQRVLPRGGLKTNVSIPRNERFTGRDEVLALLHSYLEPSFREDAESRSFSSCLIHAIGGMGKTEVALEYTYRFRKYYSHIFWLRAQTKALLQDSFLDVVSKLQLTQDEKVKPSRLIELGLEWFRTTEQPWLLVYDNAESVVPLRDFWPAGLGGAVIVTSQNPECCHLTRSSILLQPMSADEGSSLIQNYLQRGRSEKDAAEKLSSSLGGLPLAIVHFTGYITRSQCPVEQISQSLGHRLQASAIWKMDQDISSVTRAYQHTLDTVWDLAFHRLTDDAMTLLEYIAFLDPDDIPVDLFIEGNTTGVTAPESAGWEYWDILRFNTAVGILCDRHLVNRSVLPGIDSLRTHRALQMCLLQRLDDDIERRSSRFQDVVMIIRKALPLANVIKRSDASQFWRFARYLPQVTSVHRVFVQSEPPLDGSVQFASILDDVAYYLYGQFQHATALALAETGAAICTTLEDHAAKLLLPNLLSVISVTVHYHGAKGRERSLELMYRVVELRKAELDGIDPNDWTEIQSVNFARAHADLAWELFESNRPEEAAPYLCEALQVYHRIGNKVRQAQVLVNQLLVFSSRQQKQETRDQAKKALETLEEAIGPDNPLFSLMKFQAAVAYFTVGDIENAMDSMHFAFERNLMSLGHANDLTLANQYCLAVYCQNSGKLEDAENHLREVLRHGQQVNDWREEDITRTKLRLSIVLRAQSRTTEASKIRKEVEGFISEMRAACSDKEYTDANDMGLLDTAVTMNHGRTAGIWSNGDMW